MCNVIDMLFFRDSLMLLLLHVTGANFSLLLRYALMLLYELLPEKGVQSVL